MNRFERSSNFERTCIARFFERSHCPPTIVSSAVSPVKNTFLYITNLYLYKYIYINLYKYIWYTFSFETRRSSFLLLSRVSRSLFSLCSLSFCYGHPRKFRPFISLIHNNESEGRSGCATMNRRFLEFRDELHGFVPAVMRSQWRVQAHPPHTHTQPGLARRAKET